MGPKRRLTAAERDDIAAAAVQRYEQGESWAEIAVDYGLSSAYVYRLTAARHTINCRRWGQRPIADVDEVIQLRSQGYTLEAIAQQLDCSRQAVRTALERVDHAASTRYPRLSRRRDPSSAEIASIVQLYEQCPQAPRNREGFRNTRSTEGRALAEACRHLVEDGIPMATLAKSLGRGPTWIHWLLNTHDLRPEPRQVQTTSRRTRSTLT